MTYVAQRLAPAARRLARFAISSKPPQEVLDVAALHLLDLIGVALAARSLSHRPRLEDAVSFLGAADEATAIGGVAPVSAAAAALLNGSFAHALEADDTHIASVMHGSCVVVPAALAAAERADVDGRTLLQAVVVGWEALIRIGLAFPGDFLSHGFQATSVAGPFGAALAAGLVHGLAEEPLTSALGIAGSQCAGLFEFLKAGSTSKWLHGGWPALSGIAAVEFAAAGMTGPDTVLEGERGVGAAFARRTDAREALNGAIADLGEVWRIREVAVKLHPTCHFIQPYIECLEQLLDGVSPNAVAAITCYVADGMARLICEPWAQKLDPVTPYQAKWSLPYCLGAVLVYGRIGPETFDRISTDPEILRWGKLIDWKPMQTDFPQHYPARIRMVLKDGTKRCAAVADVLGCPERPLKRDAILQKFLALTERALVPCGGERLVAAAMRLAGGLTARDFGGVLRAVVKCSPSAVCDSPEGPPAKQLPGPDL
jgi:2-methylcitrate dehydratase PrpD